MPTQGQNPFMSIVQGLGQNMGQQQPQQSQEQPMQGKMMGQKPQGEEYVEPDQLEPGQNPDSTKFLMSAMSAMENFIKKGDDREDILMGRQIISLLTRLIAKDQEKYASKL